MKKQIITLLLFLAVAFGINAQTIVVRGTINNAVAGQKVWINYFSSPSTCNVNDSTSTNSSGDFTYSFTIGSGCAKRAVRLSMIGCVGIYDTLEISKNYDSSKSTDTLYYTFRYCDTCKTKASFVGWADSTKALWANLYNNSTLANKYFWRFGDGQTSTANDPKHKYAAPGLYNVCLIATDTVKGCKDSVCKYIEITYTCANFKAKFGSIDSVLKVQFYDSSSFSPTTYKWRFGDGDSSTSKNPLHTYSTAGTYNVCLIISDTVSGCRDTICKSITVKSSVCSGFKVNFIDSAVGGNNVQFINLSSSSANKFYWRFGNGSTSTSSNPSFNYSAPSTYNVCLIAWDTTNSCVDSICKNVVVNPCGSYKANFKDSAQSGNTIKFSNTSSSNANRFLWKFGNGNTSSTKNPTHTYSSPGTYTVCLIARDTINNCVDSICNTIYVNTPCGGYKANFTFSSVVKTVTFTNTTTSGATNFTWKFGNGSQSTTKNPAHTYANYGAYLVTLIAIDVNKGCVDSVKKWISINDCNSLNADFTDSFAGGKNVLFKPKNSGYLNVIYWDFGDGIKIKSTVFGNVTHTYNKSGTYNVCRIVGDTLSNCWDTVCKQVTVTFPCSSIINANGGFNFSQTNDFVSFYKTSSGTNKYHWTLGDGSFVQTSGNFYHTYADTGTYQVCLIATDTASKCADTTCKTITVTKSCKHLKASFRDSVVGTKAYFINTSQNASISYWNIGLPNYLYAKDTSYTYSNNGVYRVSLGVKDFSNQCTDSVIRYISVGANCSNYNVLISETPLGNGVIKFIGQVPSNARLFFWSFDNGNISYQKDPVINFTKPGTYNACFYAWDSAQKCLATDCKSITLINSCSGFAADFSYKVIGNKITVTNLSSPSANDFKWYFGNKTSTVKNPSTITLNPPGVYNVCLVSSDLNSGCKDSICKSVTLYDCSTLQASFSTIVNCKNISFSNTTSSNATSYVWNFGDATTSTSQNPSHSYSNAGTYNVCLIASDSVTGCIDTLCNNLSVGNSLSGVIYRDSGVLADSGMVWMIKVTIDTITNDTILKAIDSTYFIASSGQYKFNHVAPGKYLIKTALFPGTSFFSNRIPTYYTHAVQWQNASYFNMGSSCDSANIVMVKGTNPGGSGFVGGRVSQGANKVGDPLPLRQVLLFNANNTPYGYTFTDSNGQYAFSNVAFGTYRVQVEVLGKYSEDYNITMTQQNQGNLNGNFDENTKYITLSKTNGIYFVENGAKSLQLYPNPATDIVNVGFEVPQNGMASIRISDITGKLIIEKQHLTYSGANQTQLEVSGLANGLYVISIVTGDAHYVGRLSISK